MAYKNVVILGTGQLAFVCATAIQKVGLPITVFDTNKENSSYLERHLFNQNIPYSHTNKKDLFCILESTAKKTLLISAVNPIIIPAKVLNNKQITSINLHHALLPRHPGRNAEAWAIFEQDSEAGITWHYMTPEVDAGQILIQKSMVLEDTITSVKLLKFLHELAVQAFLEILDDILEEKEIHFLQPQEPRGKLHYSWEIPNEGYIDLNWDAVKISAFLRSMDYGVLETLGKPKLLLDDRCYTWKRYRIEKKPDGSLTEGVSILEPSIVIEKTNSRIILSNISLL